MNKSVNEEVDFSGLPFSLKLFFFITILIIGVSFFPLSSIAIYGENEAVDQIQVFYPEGGNYSEGNSTTRAFGGDQNKIEILLPKEYSHIRIDPGTKAGLSHISKIQVNHLFLADIYDGKRLIAHIKPTGMIGEINASPLGIKILSLGNDPQFEFRPDPPQFPVSLQLIFLGISIFLLCLLLKFICKYLKRFALYKKTFRDFSRIINHKNTISILTIVFIWSIILYGIYPGFMSYDSLHALREARGIVLGGNYPPFVSYVWRIFDFIWPGPTLMLIVQNFLILISLVVLIDKLGYGKASQIILVFIFSFLPPILGPMIVVWKDVTVAACFCFAITLLYLSEIYSSKRYVLIAFGVLFLAMASLLRFNAMIAIAPLLILLSIKRYSSNWRLSKSYLVSGIIFITIIILVGFLNSYRIPSLERLVRMSGFQNIEMYDLIGISVFSKKDYLPNNNKIENLDNIQYLTKIYEPRHLNITIDNDLEHRLAGLLGASPDVVRSNWQKAVYADPLAYISHRSAVFFELVGATSRSMFYPTHGQVDQNEYGINHYPNYVTRILLGYIDSASSFLLFRPWFYYLIGLALILAATLRKGDKTPHRVIILCILASGYSYIIPFFFIAPAADLRYNLWAIIAIILALIFYFAPNSRKTN